MERGTSLHELQVLLDLQSALEHLCHFQMCCAFLHLCVLTQQPHAGFAYNQTCVQLYVLLQSATIQDDGVVDMMQKWRCVLVWDISNPLARLMLVGEWIMELPMTKKGKTDAESKLHLVFDVQYSCEGPQGQWD